MGLLKVKQGGEKFENYVREKQVSLGSHCSASGEVLPLREKNLNAATNGTSKKREKHASAVRKTSYLTQAPLGGRGQRPRGSN